MQERSKQNNKYIKIKETLCKSNNLYKQYNTTFKIRILVSKYMHQKEKL